MHSMKPCTDSCGITVCFIHTVEPPLPLTQGTIHSTLRVDKWVDQDIPGTHSVCLFHCPLSQFLKKTYTFYLVIEVPDHVYVFYAYRLYFADKDIYMIRYFYHKIEIIRLFLLIASILVWTILVARNVITLCCINTRTLYHGPSTTDVCTETRSKHY